MKINVPMRNCTNSRGQFMCAALVDQSYSHGSYCSREINHAGPHQAHSDDNVEEPPFETWVDEEIAAAAYGSDPFA